MRQALVDFGDACGVRDGENPEELVRRNPDLAVGGVDVLRKLVAGSGNWNDGGRRSVGGFADFRCNTATVPKAGTSGVRWPTEVPKASRKVNHDGYCKRSTTPRPRPHHPSAMPSRTTAPSCGGWPTLYGAAAWTSLSTITWSSGSIFLKYISDAFEEAYARLGAAGSPVACAAKTGLAGPPSAARWGVDWP